MDPLNLVSEGQDGKSSPSHVSQHLTKSDRESLDDFEHITKETSPLQDPNLQFLSFERGPTDNLIKEIDDKGSLPSQVKSPSVGLEDFATNLAKDSTDKDPYGSSKNFMQYEQVGSEIDPKLSNLDDFLKGEPQRTPEPEKDEDSDGSNDNDNSIISPPSDKVNPADLKKPIEPERNATLDLVRVITPEPIAELIRNPTPEPILAPTPEPTPVPTPEPILAPTPKELPRVSTPSKEELQKEVSPSRPGPKISEPEISDTDEGAPPPPVRDYPEIGVLEPKEILTAFGLLEALVYWRDPKKSGVVFGSVLVVLLSLTLFSLISVVAYTSLSILVAAISFRIYKNVLQAVQKTSEGHPFNTYLLPLLQHPVVSALFQTIEEYLEVDLTLSPEKLREATDVAVTHLNSALSELRRRFLVEDLIDSLKFGLLLYVLTYIGSWFNGLTLIILGFVALFTLPKVYENNQAQIDANLDLVRAKINDVTDKVRAVIPIGRKSDETKAKDE